MVTSMYGTLDGLSMVWDFAHSFDFLALQIFAKGINMLYKASLFSLLRVRSNLHLEEWSIDLIMLSKIGVEMSTNNVHLSQFKIQGHLQNRVNDGVSKLISKKNP